MQRGEANFALIIFCDQRPNMPYNKKPCQGDSSLSGWRHGLADQHLLKAHIVMTSGIYSCVCVCVCMFASVSLCDVCPYVHCKNTSGVSMSACMSYSLVELRSIHYESAALMRVGSVTDTLTKTLTVMSKAFRRSSWKP